MKFYRELYWGEDIPEKNRFTTKFFLKVHKKSLMVYVIVLSRGSDQLEILSSLELLQDYYKANPPFVIGITKSKEEAIRLVQDMVQDCYEAYGHANLKYFLAHKEEG